MFIEFSNGDCVPMKFVNDSYPSWIRLSFNQVLAVMNRDLITAKRMGLSGDIYMSLIDPDYPAIITG